MLEWKIILGCICVIVLLDFWTVIRAKPTLKYALKSIVNHKCFMVGWFCNIVILLGIALAGAGFLELGKHSSELGSIIALNGLYWITQIMFWGFGVIFVWDMLYSWSKKRQPQYFKWAEKVGIEGIWKYTEEELAYNKKQAKEVSDKIRRWFPFIKKFDKKKVKDAIQKSV